MRKDSRLMEFNTMVNRLLQENGDSRQRALNLRTFAVHPLNEHCGLIEWVPDTDTLRQILFRLCGKMDTKKISADFNKSEKPGPGSATERRIKWMEGTLKQYPPVLHRWLLDKFPDPN